jgi:hypothetical protein
MTSAQLMRLNLARRLVNLGLHSDDARALVERLKVDQLPQLDGVLGQAYAQGQTAERNAPWNQTGGVA